MKALRGKVNKYVFAGNVCPFISYNRYYLTLFCKYELMYESCKDDSGNPACWLVFEMRAVG